VIFVGLVRGGTYTVQPNATSPRAGAPRITFTVPKELVGDTLELGALQWEMPPAVEAAAARGER